MSADSKKFTSSGCDNPLISKEQQEKIEEVRRLVWPPPEKLYNYCSDASISRYLRAWNWNVKKATKKLKETLKWRLEYKPEEIRWDEVASEAETGKLYRPKYGDKHGRTILVFKPRYQIDVFYLRGWTPFKSTITPSTQHGWVCHVLLKKTSPGDLKATPV